MNLELLLFPVAVFVASLACTRLMITLGPKLGLIDQPDARRVHQTPTPRAGGLAIWSTFLLAIFASRFLPIHWPGPGLDGTGAFIAASVILVAVGLVDDRRGVPAFLKLGGQVAAAVVYWWLKPGNEGSLFGFTVPWMIDLGFWVAWIVLLINAFNLIDGLDGLCGGLVMISLMCLSVLQICQGKFAGALSLSLMVACVGGFLVYNRHPARIFLGDTGSMVLGLFLATMASETAGRTTLIGSLLLPVAIAGVPLMDVLLAIWRRSFRNIVSQWSGRGRIGIFVPDKEHLHHRLLARGWSQRKVTRILHGLAIIMAVFAMLPSALGGKGVMLAAVFSFLVALFGLRHLASVEFIQCGSLIHLAVKRRASLGGRRFYYFLYDLVGLSAAGVLALCIDANFGKREFLIARPWIFVLVFMGVAVMMLWLLKIYQRVWSRARLREFLLVAGGLALAAGMAGTLVEVNAGDLTWRMSRVSLIAGWSAGIVILLPRALPDVLRELAVDSIHRQKRRCIVPVQRVLVYGAGDLGNLYLDYLASIPPDHFNRFQVVGFLDDDAGLLGRLVRGFEILGSLDELPRLARELRLQGVIVSIAALDSAQREKLAKLLRESGLSCYEWGFTFKLAGECVELGLSGVA